MLELNIPERDLRKMYKYWLQVDRDGSGSVDLFELLMWFDFERTEFMVKTCVEINQRVLPRLQAIEQAWRRWRRDI